MRAAMKTALLGGGLDSRRLPFGPSFQADLKNRYAYANGNTCLTEAQIKALFASFSTPAHYATGKDGILYPIPANSIDCFNMPAGQCRGQLVEGARSNLFTRSGAFTHSDWTKSQSSVTDGAVVGPDNQMSGSVLSENTANAQHNIYQAPTATAAANTASVYMKAGTGRAWSYIQTVDSGGTARNTFFDLTNGVVGAVGAGAAATITALADGWYRCAVTYTARAAADPVRYGVASGNNSSSYSGSTSFNILIAFPQIEAGAYASSYIPTTSASVTRAASSIYRTLGAEYNAAGYTLYGAGEVPTVNASVLQYLATLDDSTTAEMSYITGVGSSGVFRSDGIAASSVVWQVTAGAFAANTPFKLANAVAPNDERFSANGALGAADTSLTIPNVSRLVIGNRSTLDRPLDGYVSSVALFPRRLSNAELQALTVAA